MSKLVCVRHGQSKWNKENRFTGWVDIELSEQGIKEANEAGVLLEGGNMFVSNADGFIRLNLACPKSVLEAGLNRITEAIFSITNETKMKR